MILYREKLLQIPHLPFCPILSEKNQKMTNTFGVFGPTNKRINISIQDSRVISICYRKTIDDTQNAMIFTFSDLTSLQPDENESSKTTNKVRSEHEKYAFKPQNLGD